MVRRQFQVLVWQAVTPNDFTRVQLAEVYFIGSAINFWDFDYKASALRVILSDQELLGQLFVLSTEIIERVSLWRATRLAHPSQSGVRTFQDQRGGSKGRRNVLAR
jgi:hypothetical protein